MNQTLLTERNARTYLNVPFSSKDEAKAKGARWDGDRRAWYVPERVSLYRFGPWLTGADKLAYDAAETARAEKMRAAEEWQSLPPRSNDPREIVALVKSRIFKFNGLGQGRCVMCDSHLSTNWVLSAGVGSAVMEYWHLSDQVGGILRPSEMAILQAAIGSGFNPDCL